MAFKSLSQAFPRAVPPPTPDAVWLRNTTVTYFIPISSAPMDPSPHPPPQVFFPRLVLPPLLCLHALSAATSHKSPHPWFPHLANAGSSRSTFSPPGSITVSSCGLQFAFPGSWPLPPSLTHVCQLRAHSSALRLLFQQSWTNTGDRG